MLPQMNMQDPQVQAFIAELMRKQQAGPGAGPMQTSTPPQAPAAPPPVAPAVQAPLQSGPAPQAPQAGPSGPPVVSPQGAQLDPAMIDAALGIQAQEGQRDSARRGYALADAMRGDSQKFLQGRVIPSSTGGMYVGPNWASALAGVGGSALASRRERELDKKVGKLDAERQGAQRGYFDTLTGQMRKRDPRDDLGGWGSLSDY